MAIAGLSVSLMIFPPGCGVKSDKLPQLEFPYVAELQFLKKVENIDGKARKKRFKQDRITSPFYFFLKIKEIENNGTLKIVFYSPDSIQETKESPDSKKPAPKNTAPTSWKKQVEKQFNFGKAGGYYEYIIFFDKIEGLDPGIHRYAIFMNERLLYDGQLTINSPL